MSIIVVTIDHDNDNGHNDSITGRRYKDNRTIKPYIDGLVGNL